MSDSARLEHLLRDFFAFQFKSVGGLRPHLFIHGPAAAEPGGLWLLFGLLLLIPLPPAGLLLLSRYFNAQRRRARSLRAVNLALTTGRLRAAHPVIADVAGLYGAAREGAARYLVCGDDGPEPSPELMHAILAHIAASRADRYDRRTSDGRALRIIATDTVFRDGARRPIPRELTGGRAIFAIDFWIRTADLPPSDTRDRTIPVLLLPGPSGPAVHVPWIYIETAASVLVASPTKVDEAMARAAR